MKTKIIVQEPLGADYKYKVWGDNNVWDKRESAFTIETIKNRYKLLSASKCFFAERPQNVLLKVGSS